jgi:hypothetical protein
MSVAFADPTVDSCPLCDQWCDIGPAHRACAMREVTGGIGHLIDHDRYCVRDGDPDAGLSYRESARCVMAVCERLGVETTLAGLHGRVSLDVVRGWAGV